MKPNSCIILLCLSFFSSFIFRSSSRAMNETRLQWRQPPTAPSKVNNIHTQRYWDWIGRNLEMMTGQWSLTCVSIQHPTILARLITSGPGKRRCTQVALRSHWKGYESWHTHIQTGPINRSQETWDTRAVEAYKQQVEHDTYLYNFYAFVCFGTLKAINNIYPSIYRSKRQQQQLLHYLSSGTSKLSPEAPILSTSLTKVLQVYI